MKKVPRIWQLLLALLLAAPQTAGAQESAWTRKADMPATWGYLDAVAIGGKIYVMGGLFAGGSSSGKVVQVYDPASETWTKRASLGLDRMWLSAVVLDGRIYAVGGLNELGPVRAVEVYNPTTDTWTQKAGMPTSRMGLATCAVNGKIYAIGGCKNFRAWSKTISGNCLASVEEYDPITDTWTKKADMPTPRAALGVGVVGGLIYVLGGTSDGRTACPAVEVYDPATDTWTSKGTMPEPRCDLRAVIIGQKIYALGGLSGGWPGFVDDSAVVFTKSVALYDPASNTWSQKPDMNVRRADFAASVVDGRIYVFGGLASPKWNAVTRAMEAWDTGVRE